MLSPGGFIPQSRTSPALDLDALIGGFRPLFRALDPQKVNDIASAIITVFQGQGGTINDILDQTAQFTSTIAERDQAIGEVIKNLNIVLDTTVRHRKEFDQTVDNFEKLVTGLANHADSLAADAANISSGTGAVADLLGDNQALLKKTINYLDAIQQPIIDQRDLYADQLHRTPIALDKIARAIGSYGDFVNFYFCDITLKIQRTSAWRPDPYSAAFPAADGKVHAAMRTLEPPNRTRIGLMGLTVVLLIVAFGQTMTSVPMLFASAAYYGNFSDTGGMNKGDKVRIAGVNVGVIQSMRIDGDHIVMKFTTGGKPLGSESRLTIRTDTLLGRRVLEVEPRGTKMLRPNTTLQVNQTSQPYQIYDAVFDVTKAASNWNIDTVKQSLNVLVADHQSDLPAPERGPGRNRAVLRHRR